MNISLETQGFEAALSVFADQKYDDALKVLVFDLAGDLEMEETKNMKERIYAQPESPRYRRTGGALGGRLNTKVDDYTRRVTDDARLKNRKSRINYDIFLNKNSRNLKLNTFYRDDAIATIKASIPRKFKEAIDKIKNRL